MDGHLEILLDENVRIVDRHGKKNCRNRLRRGRPAEFFNYDRPHMWMDVLSLIIADPATLCEALAKVVLEGERNHA